LAIGVAAIGVVALGLRVGYVLLHAPDQLPIADGLYYHWLANDIADGRGYIDPLARLLLGDTHASASHPPLFPAVLAAVSFLGGTSLLAHQLTESLLDALAVVVIGALGREVAGDRVGLVAAGVAAVYPRLWANEGHVLSESLCGLAIALMLLTAYRFWRQPGLRTGAALGFAVGVAALSRAEGLLYLPFLVVPLVVRVPRLGARQRRAALAVAAAGTLVAVGPWTLANLTRFEKPILISSSTGLLIAGANCDTTYHGELLGWWNVDCADRPFPGDESERSEALRRLGTEYALDHLDRLPVVVAARVGRAFDVYDTRSTEWTAGAWTGWVLLYSWYALVPVAITGAVILRRRRAAPVFPLLVPAFVIALAVAATWGSPRFRVGVDVAFVVLAAVALEAAGTRLRARARTGQRMPSRLRNAVGSPR
jgi:4-amino-4-deoxy-L-arabinose transferase-like glycosyltransferase